MPKVGGHVSAAVSLETAFIKSLEIGAECIQYFVSPPRQWAKTKHDDAEIQRFLTAQRESGVGPNFIHGTYLVNLGTDNPEHLEKSIDWLIWAMEMAEKLGSRGVIFHPGSFGKRSFEEVFPQIVSALKKILDHTAGKGGGVESSQTRTADFDPAELDTESRTGFEIPHRQSPGMEPYLILENSAGAGGNIGGNFHQFGQILKAVNAPRLKVCLDTQHSFASGYDLRTELTLKDVLAEFDQEIGLGYLVAIHCNDSKTEYKSNRDRHENIGEGLIGKDAFENMLNAPELKDVPFLLEVPGFADNGPDKENVNLLKSLRH